MSIRPLKGRPIYPFSYYGGKVNMFKWIAQHLPPAHSFVDVYSGSGVVALNMVGCYKRVVYNDLDHKVVNFFRVLRENPESLLRALALTPCAREEHARAWDETEDCVEQARRTFVKITQSYGKIGLRDNRSGWLLPQMGSNRTSSINSRVDNLWSVVHALREMEVECKPGLELIRKEDREDTLLFADPPYVHDSRSAPQAYYHEMNDEDHADMCEALCEVKSKAVVCGYDNDLYAEKLKTWKVVRKPTYSASAATKRTGSNSRRVECLWIKD